MLTERLSGLYFIPEHYASLYSHSRCPCWLWMTCTRTFPRRWRISTGHRRASPCLTPSPPPLGPTPPPSWAPPTTWGEPMGLSLSWCCSSSLCPANWAQVDRTRFSMFCNSVSGLLCIIQDERWGSSVSPATGSAFRHSDASAQGLAGRRAGQCLAEGQGNYSRGKPPVLAGRLDTPSWGWLR